MTISRKEIDDQIDNFKQSLREDINDPTKGIFNVESMKITDCSGKHINDEDHKESLPTKIKSTIDLNQLIKRK